MIGHCGLGLGAVTGHELGLVGGHARQSIGLNEGVSLPLVTDVDGQFETGDPLGMLGSGFLFAPKSGNLLGTQGSGCSPGAENGNMLRSGN